MNLNIRNARHALLGLALIHISLIVAFTLRFLFIYFSEKIDASPSYWQFLHYTLIGFRNSIIPMIVIGTIVLYIESRLKSRVAKVSPLTTNLISLCLFYCLMFATGTVLSRQFTFPREIWILAFCISVTVSAFLMVLRRLDPGFRQGLIYNRAGHCTIDCAVIGFAFLISYVVRFDGVPPPPYQQQFWLLVPYMILLYLSMNFVWGIYTFVWRFTGLREALVFLLSTTTSGLIGLLLRILVLQGHESVRVPFGVLLTQPALTFFGFIGVRMLRRMQYNHSVRNKSAVKPGDEKRVLLIGAGNAGILLVRELESRRNFQIVGFLDDDRRKQGSVINGVRVLGTTTDISTVIRERNIHEAIFCMPSAPRSVIKRLAFACSEAGIATSSVPSLSEIVLGQVNVGELRPVRMEHLLGRASIEFDSRDTELFCTYGGKRILVTGAAGSIGSELVRQIKSFNPATLLLLDKDENGLYEIGLEIREQYQGTITEIVADVRDRNRLERVFQRHSPQAILHAAAYKHVPMMEYHPSEAVLNNIIGTKNVVELASQYGADSFLLISTDKAVNPTSVMGASKRVAEMLVRHRSLQCNGSTRFCAVRFGNVLGSRASVVPLFQKWIAEGKNIQVTHPEIKRYFMTIPEAVQLVIQAGSLGKHGETFVLDMGKPIKIADLARKLIEQSGLIPEKDIDVVFTGLRPGEKLFEELLLTPESGTRSTKYSKIFIDKPIEYDWALLDSSLKEFERAARTENIEEIYQIFHNLNIGYERKGAVFAASANS